MPHRLAPTALAVLALAGLSASLPDSATAQTPQTPPPVICQQDAAYRQFDFWVGEWEVFGNQNGALAGRNHIEARHGGCVLVERWESNGGGGGMSMNYYDGTTGLWRQVWVSVNYNIDIQGGLDDQGRMVLEGEIHTYPGGGQSLPFRGTWTPQADGNVRQLFEQQDPSTGAWQVWFDGRYEPRGGQVASGARP